MEALIKWISETLSFSFGKARVLFAGGWTLPSCHSAKRTSNAVQTE
jgi:hypothetical protein